MAVVVKHCGSCGAPIFWLKHETTGRAAPIDAVAVEEGNIKPDFNHQTYSIANAEQRADAKLFADAALFTNHFMTCPNARKHRKEAK